MSLGPNVTERLNQIRAENGNSLAVPWLGLHASTAGSTGSIPGWGTKILHAARRAQKNKQETDKGTEVLTGFDKVLSKVFLRD